MVAPIQNQIGAVFVPVRNIEAARDWYCRLLGIPAPDVAFGHICVIPMRDGSGLVLDSKNSKGPHTGKPIFHFNTDDLSAAHAFAVSLGVAGISPVTDDAFFTFEDPDGNLLMVANVPPAPRSK
jgi:catechol 2,3-dioxygenase-like lactoylglutathione lyase family enzyme